MASVSEPLNQSEVKSEVPGQAPSAPPRPFGANSAGPVPSAPPRPSPNQRPTPDIPKPLENPRPNSTSDTSETVENPELKEAIKIWKENTDPDSTGLNVVRVHTVFGSKARLLLVFEGSEDSQSLEDGKVLFDSGTARRFPAVTGEDGKGYLPLFSDLEELSHWQGIASPPQTAVLKYDEICTILDNREDLAGLIIDPFGDSFVISLDDLDSMKEARKQANEARALRQTATEM